MKKEIIIRVQTSSEKGNCCKAIKVAAGIKGVESVTLAGEDKNLLLVIGVGVDSNRITKKLRKKVGHAEVVELRTVDDEIIGGLVIPAEHAYRYNHHPSQSPYSKHQQQHYYAGGRDHYHPSPYNKYQQHAGGSMTTTYSPPTMAAGGRDYYYGGGGYYPAQYQHQQRHFYQPPPGNTHTVVYHDNYANDPNSCSIM